METVSLYPTFQVWFGGGIVLRLVTIYSSVFNLMKNDSFCHFHQNTTFCICSLEISVVLIFSKKDNDTQISVVQYQNKSMNSSTVLYFVLFQSLSLNRLN